MWSKFFNGIGNFQWFDFFFAAYLSCYLLFVVFGICHICWWMLRKNVLKNVTVQEDMERDLHMMKSNDIGLVAALLALFCFAALVRHW